MKKLRGAMQRNSLELLQATADIHPVSNPALEKVPEPAVQTIDPKLEAAMQAVEKQKLESEIAPLLKEVDSTTLAAALQAAKENALAFEASIAQANQVVKWWTRWRNLCPPGTNPPHEILLRRGCGTMLRDTTQKPG